MADVFLSYASEDRAAAGKLAAQLMAAGLTVWWDRDLAGGARFLKSIEAELTAAKAVLVCWSRAAIESHWVADEATLGRDTQRLVPISLDGSQPPLGFRQFQVIDFSRWGHGDAKALPKLLGALAPLVKRDPPADLTPISSRRLVSTFLANRSPISLTALVVLATLGVGLALGVLAHRGDRTAAQPSSRAAFFGVDAPAGDLSARAVAEAAENSVTATFSALRQDSASRTEIEGTPRDKRLERAVSVGATYAISGAVTRQGDEISITLQIEDAPSRTLLWADTLEAQAPATRLGKQAATQIVDTLNCFTQLRASLPRDDLNVVSKLSSQFCRTLRTSLGVSQWRELASLAPSSAYVQAFEAVRLLDTLDSALPVNQAEVRAEIIAAADRAFKLGPNSPFTQIARVAAAEARGASLREREAVFLDGLKRAPDAANLNARYGNLLWQTGRLEEALPYLRTGLDRDPLSPAKALHAASAAGSLGLTAEAAARHARLYDRWYSASTWTDYLAAAIFRGVGDVDALLADPPSNLPSQSLACWTDIAKAQRSSDRTARRRGAARAAQCQANGAIRVDLALLASAFLGDLDRTFLLADGVQDQILRDRGFAETLFYPRLSAPRADARFAPLMERQQLVAYWRDSGNRPDFCRVEKAPVCLMISKGAQALR